MKSGEQIAKDIADAGYSVIKDIDEGIGPLEEMCKANHWVAHYAYEHQGYKVIPNLHAKPEVIEEAQDDDDTV